MSTVSFLKCDGVARYECRSRVVSAGRDTGPLITIDQRLDGLLSCQRLTRHGTLRIVRQMLLW